MARGGKREGAGRRPGSRLTKAKRDLAEIAKGHAPAAMKTLAEISAKGETESARVTASIAILDRAYGKPTQAVQHTGAVGTYDLTRVSDADLDRLETILGPLADAGGDQGGEEPSGA